MTTDTQAITGLAAVPADHIHPSPNNPRENLTGIEELAGSIRENGLIQPLVVQRIPGKLGVQIVAGHRRYAAVRKLGWAKVPCIIRRDMLPDEELLAMLVENGQRAGLDPIEEARALQVFVRSGAPVQEVSRRIGRSRAYVDSRLLLLQLPLEEQEAVRAGHYTLGHAAAIIRGERAAQRRRAQPEARPVGRPKGAKTKPYFGDTHPLAKAARTLCGHRGTPKVGGVACGECWELVIRDDARSASSTRSPTSASPASVGVSDAGAPTPQIPEPERTSA